MNPRGGEPNSNYVNAQDLEQTTRSNTSYHAQGHIDSSYASAQDLEHTNRSSRSFHTQGHADEDAGSYHSQSFSSEFNSRIARRERRASIKHDLELESTMHLTDSTRPTSLGEFFRDFWQELKSLLKELIEYGRTKTWKKKILTVLLCVSSMLVFYDLLFGDYIIDNLEEFVHWMAFHPTSAVFAFVFIFVISTLIFIPPTLLMFGAGYAFSRALGFWWGIISAAGSCFIGSCIGAIIAFLRSRYMMRDLIYLFSKRYPLVRAADRALKRNGFRIMVLLRLCPLIPFNGLNYCCGITGVKVEEFTASLVGILPFQIYIVVVGATTGSLALDNANNKENYSDNQQLGWIILLASGIAFGLLALVYTWKVVKKELREELEMTPEQFQFCLHADEMEREQGGIETSVEVNQQYGQMQNHGYQPSPSQVLSPQHVFSDQNENEGGIEILSPDEPWLEEGEEWFWVWA